MRGRRWETAAARDNRFAVERASDTLAGIELDGNVSQPTLIRPGVIGNALSMTPHEQVQVNNAALDLREDLTIEFWVNPDRMHDSWTPLVNKGDRKRDVSGKCLSVRCDPGGLRIIRTTNPNNTRHHPQIHKHNSTQQTN